MGPDGTREKREHKENGVLEGQERDVKKRVVQYQMSQSACIHTHTHIHTHMHTHTHIHTLVHVQTHIESFGKPKQKCFNGRDGQCILIGGEKQALEQGRKYQRLFFFSKKLQYESRKK